MNKSSIGYVSLGPRLMFHEHWHARQKIKIRRKVMEQKIRDLVAQQKV